MLEGIGYLEKNGKNIVRVITDTNDNSKDIEITELSRTLEQMEEEEFLLEKKLQHFQELMEEYLQDQDNRSNLFLNESDIKGLMRNCEKSCPFIFIEAKENTKIQGYQLDESNPEEEMHNSIFIESPTSMQVYLLAQHEDDFKGNTFSN